MIKDEEKEENENVDNYWQKWQLAIVGVLKKHVESTMGTRVENFGILYIFWTRQCWETW
jgi:hypothetical protein